MATTDDEECTSFRITLTGTKRKTDCAIATMPGASVAILASAIDLDYESIISRCREITLPLITGQVCTIHTFDPQGKQYTLQFNLPGVRRPPIQSYGIISRGAWGNIPAGETFVAPLEDSANGDYLVTGVVGKEIMQSHQGALLQFKQGRLIKHSYLSNGLPVRYLDDLERVAHNHGQDACWNIIAEFGIGMNELIKKLTGIQLVDEKAYGSVHIAIGHNSGYGGSTSCGSVHCDITTMRPTVIIDGHVIIERGNHVPLSKHLTANFRVQGRTIAHLWDPKTTFVHLNDNSYELDAEGRLFVKRKTSSGRYTVYVVGDDETQRLAGTVVALFRGQVAVHSTVLQKESQLPEADFHGLLTVLVQAGIVRP